jgi:creatinine amidohydrolase
MKRRASLLVVLAIALQSQGVPAGAQGQSRIDAPRPIDAGTSLWAEELTWMEIRDLIKAGTTTIIIGTGGVEQSGPYVAGGKHNFVLQTVLPYIARAIPNSLIAPIVKFVPEGRIEPAPGGHMRYPGTIGLDASTYEALLTDICRSYKAHGFTDIILLGDSGGNQAGMRKVAEALNGKWAAETARVHFLPEYYDQDRWSYDYLKTLGITQIDKTPGQPADARADTRNGMHDDIYYEAQIAVLDPALIRVEQRRKAGLLNLHGVDLSSTARVVEIGRKLAEYRAGITARAFKASLQKVRSTPAVATQPGNADTATAEALKGIEQQVAAAWKSGNCDAWGAFIAPEWSVIHVTGDVVTRAQALQMCRAPEAPITTLTSDDLLVRVFGDSAVVTGRTNAATGGAKPEALTLRFTDVFVRRAGRWQIVASHATRVPR